MYPERATRLLAEKTHALNEALEQAFKEVRADVPNWGLDPLGMDRVLAAVAAFETSTAVDMTTWRLTNVGVHTNLVTRLQNVRDLKKACTESLADARRCEWLREWLVEAEADADAGLTAVLAPRQRVLA